MLFVKFVFAAVLIAYPVLVYFGLLYLEARFVALILVILVAARLVLAKQLGGRTRLAPQILVSLGAALIIGFLAFISNSKEFLKYYPVLMSVVMLALFFSSILRPPSVIERLARIRTPDLPPEAVLYTRKVTLVWCGFFVLNGAVSLYTCLATNMEIWALYNGLISYILMGVLFAGEFLIRRRLKRGQARAQLPTGGC